MLKVVHLRVLTLRAALAELLTKVLSSDAGTGGVTRLPWVVTWLVIIHVIGRAICKRRSDRLFSNHYHLHFTVSCKLVIFFLWTGSTLRYFQLD